MPENTIVVRPSKNRPDLDQYDDIVKNKLARGFAASCERIEELPYIIVTDGFGQAILGNIVDVECEEPISVTGQRRVNITFDNVREPENLCEKIHRGENNPNGIKWSSKNVRYIELPALD